MLCGVVRLIANHRSSTSSKARLKQGSFPPPALPGFNGNTGLSVTPRRPACPSRASGWSSLTSPWGFPCCVRFPCVHAVATTPAQRLGVLLRSLHLAVSAFPERVIGSACASSFSRLARRSLALRPAHSRGHQFVARYTEGFSHFVTSMTAPVASGWSVRRVGLAPTGKRRLVTAHTQSGHGNYCPGLSRPSISLRSAVKSIGLVNKASAPPSKALRLVSLSP